MVVADDVVVVDVVEVVEKRGGLEAWAFCCKTCWVVEEPVWREVRRRHGEEEGVQNKKVLPEGEAYWRMMMMKEEVVRYKRMEGLGVDHHHLAWAVGAFHLSWVEEPYHRDHRKLALAWEVVAYHLEDPVVELSSDPASYRSCDDHPGVGVDHGQVVPEEEGLCLWEPFEELLLACQVDQLLLELPACLPIA